MSTSCCIIKISSVTVVSIKELIQCSAKRSSCFRTFVVPLTLGGSPTFLCVCTSGSLRVIRELLLLQHKESFVTFVYVAARSLTHRNGAVLKSRPSGRADYLYADQYTVHHWLLPSVRILFIDVTCRYVPVKTAVNHGVAHSESFPSIMMQRNKKL